MYSAYKICYHSTAVTEEDDKIADFIQWFSKHNSTPILTKLLMVEIPKGAGEKIDIPGKHTRSSVDTLREYYNIGTSESVQRFFKFNTMFGQPGESILTCVYQLNSLAEF